MNRLSGHTQTQAALKAGAWTTPAAVAAAYLNQRFGWHVSDYWIIGAAGYLVSALTAVRFYIGQRGLAGAWYELLHGRTPRPTVATSTVTTAAQTVTTVKLTTPKKKAPAKKPPAKKPAPKKKR